MWDKASYDALIKAIPFGIEVDWAKRPSAEKYGCVNALLVILDIFNQETATFHNIEGEKIHTLEVTPLHRKLTDQKKRNFTIVGHYTGFPLLIIRVVDLLFEVFFNHHFLVETSTTYRQYYPSASVILRCRNFLESAFVTSSGSWGPDIIRLTYDWEGTFILETSLDTLSAQRRKNFRGFKLVLSDYKYIMFSRKQPKSEMTFLANNGFHQIGVYNSLNDFSDWIISKTKNYLRKQRDRWTSITS